MTEEYEKTGETAVEHARVNKIRGLSSCYEIAVDRETFDSLLSFVKSKSNVSISFNSLLDGYSEMFSLYRFVNDEKTRVNIFIHTDKFGYEELISLNTFEAKDQHINGVTTEGHSYSFYPVGDLEKHEIYSLVGHIMERTIKLSNMLKARGDDNNSDLAELIYGYAKAVYNDYG